VRPRQKLHLAIGILSWVVSTWMLFDRWHDRLDWRPLIILVLLLAFYVSMKRMLREWERGE